MISAIIFDYYGVLTTDRYMAWLQRHPAVEATHAADIEALSQDQDAGLSSDEFFARLAKIADLPEAAVRSEFVIHGVAHQGLVEYIRHLRRRGLKTAILSNATTALYAEVVRQRLARLFDVVLCSEEAGATKPDPRIFEQTLERLGVSPAQALLVDDREYNVAGAEAAGLAGIHYDGLTKLRAELIARGIDR
ncbi:MAG TPA: HAD-IA family hydrolase [Candidatus Saccharimonadia bacterium]|nr:HAD-IA family hydrolase [Candidatus Saccharimonadia bacterium]